MNSIICTLFEGKYHYGVATLANTLYNQGFRGSIFAGYKGTLPYWSESAKENNSFHWKGATSLEVSENLIIHFLPLTTDYHLTNYKPDFMLSLIKGPAKTASTIFYYDPDIVQVAPWFFMEDWVSSGVAVCEDINSPLEENHPKRVYWRKYFKKFDQILKFKNRIYVNGGFIGLNSNDFPFLNLWQKIQENMAEDFGGLNHSIFNKGGKLIKGKINGFYAFGKTDQDALNATIECYKGNFSYLGKEAMNFSNGQMVLPHAIGKIKPWNNNLIWNWIKKGAKPSIIDEIFWTNSLSPITLYPTKLVKWNIIKIKTLYILSRFYKNKSSP